MDSTATDKFILEMTGILSSTKDFVVEQAPDVIKQMLEWGFLESILNAVSFLAIGSLCFYAIRKSVLYFNSPDRSSFDDAEVPYALAALFGTFGLIVCFAGVSSNTSIAVKIKTAPKVYLLDRLSQLTANK